jgi:5'-deoxynucleotidase YfbR-like HD superfamily hydrolase
MISPFKAALGLDYRVFETALEQAIHIRFGLPPKVPSAIKALTKRADLTSAYFEAVQLAGFSPKEAGALFGAPPAGYTLLIEPLAPTQAQTRYLERFQTLTQAAGFAAAPAAFNTE